MCKTGQLQVVEVNSCFLLHKVNRNSCAQQSCSPSRWRFMRFLNWMVLLPTSALVYLLKRLYTVAHAILLFPSYIFCPTCKVQLCHSPFL